MSEIIAGVIGLLSSVVVSVISFYGARKLGIGAPQAALVATYKDLTTAQDSRIEQLESDNVLKDKEIESLKVRVAELEKVVLNQARQLAGGAGV